jgi:hypothetical protein
MEQVFLSYARADSKKAKRLFNDLRRKASLRIWFDDVDLLPGQRWESAIRKAIRESRYFIAVLSHEGVSTPGFRHTEVSEAIEEAKKFPEDWIYLIPTRLDDCRMPFQTMEAFHHVDLFRGWADGVKKICRTLKHRVADEKDVSKGKTLDLLTVGGGIQPIKIASSKRRQYRRSRAPHVKQQPYPYKIPLVNLGHGIATVGRIARGLNTVQSCFHFTYKRLAAPHQALITEDGLPQLCISQLPQSFYKRIGPLEADSVMCVTRRLLAIKDKGTLYYNNLADRSPDDSRFLFISQSGLDDYAKEAGVTLDTATAYLITAQLVAFFFDFKRIEPSGYHYHGKTSNCPMDYNENHSDLVPGLRAGRFCNFCSGKLDKIGQFGKAFKAMIAWGR